MSELVCFSAKTAGHNVDKYKSSEERTAWRKPRETFVDVKDEMIEERKRVKALAFVQDPTVARRALPSVTRITGTATKRVEVKCALKLCV